MMVSRLHECSMICLCLEMLKSWLHLHLLPRDNCLLSIMYRTKVLTNKVGLCSTFMSTMVVYYFDSNTRDARVPQMWGSLIDGS
jgi:hypothetical protein